MHEDSFVQSLWDALSLMPSSEDLLGPWNRSLFNTPANRLLDNLMLLVTLWSSLEPAKAVAGAIDDQGMCLCDFHSTWAEAELQNCRSRNKPSLPIKPMCKPQLLRWTSTPSNCSKNGAPRTKSAEHKTIASCGTSIWKLYLKSWCGLSRTFMWNLTFMCGTFIWNLSVEPLCGTF